MRIVFAILVFAVAALAQPMVKQPCRAGVTTNCTPQADGNGNVAGVVPTTTTVNGHALSSNVTVTNADLGAVPTTTTVNGHALSGNVAVTNADLGAVPTTTTVNGHDLSANVTVTNADLGATPTSTTVNGHPLSAPVVVSAADITTGVLTPTASVCYLTSNIGATNSVTPANVCAGWPLLASKSYALHCQLSITYVTSATVGFTLAGPGSPAHWAMTYGGLTGASAAWESKNATGTTSYTAVTTGAPGGVTEVVILDAGITNGTTASGTNLTLTTKGNGTNNINVLADSYCSLMQMN